MKLLKPDIYEEAVGLLVEYNSAEDRNYEALRKGLLRRSRSEEAARMLEACEEIRREISKQEDLEDGLFAFPVNDTFQLGQLLWLCYHRPGSGKKPSEYLISDFMKDEGCSFVKIALGMETPEQIERQKLQEELFAAELSETVKYRILEVWLNPYPALERLCSMVERTAELLGPYLEKHRQMFGYAESFLQQPGAAESLQKRLEVELDEDRVEILPLLTGMNGGCDSEYELDEAAGSDAGKNEKSRREVFGAGLLFFVMDCLEGSRTEDVEELAARLKCFTDETKLKILFLLAEKDCYQAEIARQLGLTPATISHHLDMLRNNGIVKTVMRDNRFFYQLQRDRVSMIARVLDKRLGRGEESPI